MKLLYTIITLGSLSVANAQSALFLEEIYLNFWLKDNPYDEKNSQCTSDADCAKSGAPAEHSTCGLMEYLDVTSIQVTQFVQYTRTKQCMKKADCGKQLLHKYSGYRILTFCDAEMEYRLTKGLFLEGLRYYNVGVSDYQCIKDNVGEDCKDEAGDAGTCVMLQTVGIQKTNLIEWNQVQRQTLHTICLPKHQEIKDDLNTEDASGRNRLFKFAISDIRLKNYELRMMDNTLAFCDREKDQLTYLLPDLDDVNYEYVNQVARTDIASHLLDQYKASGPCPTVAVGTKIAYVSDQVEANELTTTVQYYFEARNLRYFFYFPSFTVLCIVLFCGFCFIIIKIGHIIFISKRDKKRQKRTKSLQERNGQAKHTIKDNDVKWPNTAEGKGWKISDFEKEIERIQAMPEDSLERLEGFARLFAKSLDLIVTALSSNRTIPHAIFRIRDHFAREISDCELPFVLEHVEALVDVTKREQGDSEALTAQERAEVDGLIRFFQDQEKACAPRPSLQELPNFQQSALYADRIGQRLLTQNQYSLALFLRMYIQERFSAYKETIGQRFKDEKAEPKCANWSVKNDFQKNAVQIWQHYTDYRRPGFLKKFQAWMINIVIATCQLVLGVTLIATFVGICCPPHLREQTAKCWAWILIPCIVCGLLIYFLNKIKNPQTWDLAAVDDLVQGSIEAQVGELKAAYLHFRDMPQIEIVNVRQQLRDFQKVTVNYVYDQAFIGEMDFRFRPWTQVYHAKLFLQEIGRAVKPIEVLQSLNYMEIFLSLNEQLDTDKTADILQERPQYKEDSDPELDLDAIEYTAKAGGERGSSVFKGYTRPGEAGSLEMQALQSADQDSYQAQIISQDIKKTKKVTKTVTTSNQIIS